MTDALSYLHNTEGLIHCNVGPHSVLLTRRGHWKLSGFEFVEEMKAGKVNTNRDLIRQSLKVTPFLKT